MIKYLCAAVMAVALALPAAAAADSGAVGSVEQTGPNDFEAFVSATVDSCSSTCSWFPEAHWIPSNQQCAPTPPFDAFVWVGTVTSGNGTQSSAESFSTNGEQDFDICIYVSPPAGAHLVAEVPSSALSVLRSWTPVKTLSRRKALQLTRSALRERYGKRFSRRQDFSQKCSRLSRIRIRCAVKWKYNGTFSGTVTHSGYTEDGDQLVRSRIRVRHKKPMKPHAKSDPRSGCDPSYPGVCIPSPPPDLDCPEISYTDFTVVGSDPHGFDSDGDGVGCET